uniref:Exocyst complex component Sec3 PIP2-binding N-terminal domain-containing protein n=1 Tax=Leptobrachium leishanense TaxID=445787 RepID=A0A8C5Q624_9ANUR
MSTATKMNFDKEVFRIRGERLVHVLQLTNVNKEDVENYLCTSVTSTNGVCITWLSIREEGSTINYERKHTWLLKDLTLIDGINALEDNARFDMHFGNHIYTLTAYSTASKYAFLRCIRKMSDEYLHGDLRWLNFDQDFVGSTSCVLVADDITLTMKLCIEASGFVCLFICI